MKKDEAVNTFNNGMVMDINPIVTPNDSLCNALNATLVTFNGNENVLLCDMGNGRVETACLPPGYIPIGTTLLGGIIYIASYNPLTSKSLIGCFPSPERNITLNKLETPDKPLQINDLFDEEGKLHIKSKLKKLILLDNELHPGDKFLIGCELLKAEGLNFISAKEEGNTNSDKYPKYLKLNVVAILDNGVINSLNNSLIWHDNNYYILDTNLSDSTNSEKPNLSEYRNLIQSNYNVFDSKVDGKLAIIAELECIDTFSVSWDAVKSGNNWNFYFYLNWTYNNQVSSDKINLYGIGIKTETKTGTSEILDKIITTYPKSTYGENNDICNENNKNVIFYTPCYVDSLDSILKEDPSNPETSIYADNDGITSPRRNDGTDNLFILNDPYPVSTSEGIVNFTIYPKMPFGYLDWLKQSFSVDINNLGTGKIKLVEYRYYYNDDNIILNWGLDAYPERNKKIKSVEFEFYEYSHAGDIMHNYLSDEDNTCNILNNYAINDKWANTIIDYKFLPDIITSNKKVYSITGKPSYSGHFLELLRILDKNKLYLVRIIINYNDEKKLYYHRFMYTCNIFNKYYFDLIDYSQIRLEDAIKDTITFKPTDISITDILTTDKCFKDGQDELDKLEILSFTEYKDTLVDEKYNIERTYNNRMEFGIEGSTGFSGIDIFIQNFERNGDVIDTFSPLNPRKTSISNDLMKSDTSILGDISRKSEHNITIDKGKYIDRYELTLEIPMLIDYHILSIINVPYQLDPLDISVLWLLVDGNNDKWVALYLSDVYSRANSNIIKTLFGDNASVCGSLSRYKEVYDELKNRMDFCDVLVLRFRVHENAAGKRAALWGFGKWHGGEESANFDHFKIYKEDNYNLILYLFKDYMGTLLLTTFGKYMDYLHPNLPIWLGWYGAYGVPHTDSNSWVENNAGPFALNKDVEDKYLIAPFSKYYKVMDSSLTLEKYKWSKVYYYDNFTWLNITKIPLNIEFNLFINSNVILSIPGINNLEFNNSIQYTLETSISNMESFDNWIDKILYSSINSYLVALPANSNGIREIKSIQVSQNYLYDKDGNRIEFLKADLGEVDKKLIDLRDTRHKLQCIDGKVYFKKGLTYSGNIVNIMGRSEELNIAISNIILLNEEYTSHK